jgi:hypothetical protein
MVVEKFGTGAQFGALHATGTLVVDEDHLLRLLPDRATRAAARLLNVPGAPEPTELVHASDVVDVFVSRLLPPWMNVRVVVHDRDRTAVASLPRWELGRLRRVLADAGLQPRVERRWFYTADDRVKPWP